MVNDFHGVGRLAQDPSVGYKAHWGVYDASDGIFFLVQDVSFGIGTRKLGVDSITWNGDFNGILGSTIVTNFLTPKRFNIIYGGSMIEFYINSELIHRQSNLLSPPTCTLNLPVTVEIENTGNTNSNEIAIRAATVYRIGQLSTSPVYKYIEGATTTLLKYGSGNLHTILNLDDKGRLTVYDNNSITPIDGSTQIIADIDMTKAKYGMQFNCDFNYGLYIIATDAGLKATIVYE
jgi:hypothetical protein